MNHELPDSVVIRRELRPGDIGYLTFLHGTLYSAEFGWDHRFDAYVAGPLAEFAKRQNDPQWGKIVTEQRYEKRI